MLGRRFVHVKDLVPGERIIAFDIDSDFTDLCFSANFDLVALIAYFPDINRRKVGRLYAEISGDGGSLGPDVVTVIVEVINASANAAVKTREDKAKDTFAFSFPEIGRESSR